MFDTQFLQGLFAVLVARLAVVILQVLALLFSQTLLFHELGIGIRVDRCIALLSFVLLVDEVEVALRLWLLLLPLGLGYRLL